MRSLQPVLLIFCLLSLAPVNDARAACPVVLTRTMGTHMHRTETKRTKASRQNKLAKRGQNKAQITSDGQNLTDQADATQQAGSADTISATKTN